MTLLVYAQCEECGKIPAAMVMNRFSGKELEENILDWLSSGYSIKFQDATKPIVFGKCVCNNLFKE